MSSSQPDAQVIELLGRNLLVTELLRAGLEVALPIRDRGIDLIAYADTGEGIQKFGACPIQMKAASEASFSVSAKYEAFPGLLIAFVWYVAEPARAVTYALTYEETVAVAKGMGYTESPSYQGLVKSSNGKPGSYSSTRIGKRLRHLLEPYQMTPAKWRAKIATVAAAR